MKCPRCGAKVFLYLGVGVNGLRVFKCANCEKTFNEKQFHSPEPSVSEKKNKPKPEPQKCPSRGLGGEPCPMCGSSTMFVEGCRICPSCGWSLCG